MVLNLGNKIFQFYMDPVDVTTVGDSGDGIHLVVYFYVWWAVPRMRCFVLKENYKDGEVMIQNDVCNAFQFSFAKEI